MTPQWERPPRCMLPVRLIYGRCIQTSGRTLPHVLSLRVWFWNICKTTPGGNGRGGPYLSLVIVTVDMRVSSIFISDLRCYRGWLLLLSHFNLTVWKWTPPLKLIVIQRWVYYRLQAIWLNNWSTTSPITYKEQTLSALCSFSGQGSMVGELCFVWIGPHVFRVSQK